MISCEKHVNGLENSLENCEECSELKALEARGLPQFVTQVNNHDASNLRNDLTNIGRNIKYNEFNWSNASYIKLKDNSIIYSIEHSEKDGNQSESIKVVENSSGINYYHIIKNYTNDNEVFSGSMSIWDINNDEHIQFDYNDNDGFTIIGKGNKCTPTSVGQCMLDNLNAAGGWELVGCMFIGKWCAVGLVTLCTLCIIDGDCNNDIYCQ